MSYVICFISLALLGLGVLLNCERREIKTVKIKTIKPDR